MPSSLLLPRVLALGGLVSSLIAFLPSTSLAQSFISVFPTPALDRWNYRFASTAPVPTESRLFSTFFSPFQSAFDDRDGEHLIGFDTAPTIPSGQATSRYRIRSAALTLRVSRDSPSYTNDPTHDLYNTYLPSTPGFTPDSDTGRPIEVFGVGYRGGFSVQTFTQTSPYSNSPQPTSSLRDRNAFPIVYSSTGAILDVSNNVKENFDARPFATGLPQTNSFQPNPVAIGASIPMNTDIVFTLDMTNPDVIRYLREGLSAGRVNLSVTSLQPTDQQAANVPAFYLAAFATQFPELAGLGYAPGRLNISACVGAPGDWDCSGVVNVSDIFAFLADWFAGRGDFNASGTTSVDDIFAFLAAWFAR